MRYELRTLFVLKLRKVFCIYFQVATVVLVQTKVINKYYCLSMLFIRYYIDVVAVGLSIY